MKRFLTYCALFVMPGALLFVAMEVIVGFIPNSYSYKYNYVKANGGDIQALAVGHSQLYDGFMPEAFFLPAFNLCNSAQSYIDDYYLMRELLDDMPNLQVVILPIGYVDVGVPVEEGYLTDRACFYHKYMHLDYAGRLPLKYWFECFAPRRTWDKIWMYFVEHPLSAQQGTRTWLRPHFGGIYMSGTRLRQTLPEIWRILFGSNSQVVAGTEHCHCPSVPSILLELRVHEGQSGTKTVCERFRGKSMQGVSCSLS